MKFLRSIGRKNIVDMAKNEGYNQDKKEKWVYFILKYKYLSGKAEEIL